MSSRSASYTRSRNGPGRSSLGTAPCGRPVVDNITAPPRQHRRCVQEPIMNWLSPTVYGAQKAGRRGVGAREPDSGVAELLLPFIPSCRQYFVDTVRRFRGTPSTERSSHPMKVAVLGAGAIGAYVGAALHRAGADVHLIARGPHLAAMRQNGVQILSPRGDFTAHTHATDDPADIGPVDYVFLGLKATSYAACGPLIEPLLHPDTAVIAAQNGIPWWYFHAHGGPHNGHRLESVDPG
ncbi:ketopantoate reductase family protein, partial [Streptomyces sp. NPDC051913]|uniref:ketopantoate reductase family protein n=1 Tax=Streptomyces sp. NPDC051913 TaxID=3365676 RepID=UPI0037CFFBB3